MHQGLPVPTYISRYSEAIYVTEYAQRARHALARPRGANEALMAGCDCLCHRTTAAIASAAVADRATGVPQESAKKAWRYSIQRGLAAGGQRPSYVYMDEGQREVKLVLWEGGGGVAAPRVLM